MLATVLSLSILALSSVVKTAPLVPAKRGLDQIIDNCYRGFAYTWDDGSYHSHDIINNIFTAASSHTTFFVNGNNYNCIYDDENVQYIRHSYEQGHQIAHHTWSHAHLTQLSHDEIDVEIQRLNDAFVKILGVKPKFLRPPYGEINDDVANYLQTKWGLTIVTWSDDSLDSDGQDSQQHNYDYYVNLANTWNGSPVMSLSHETVPGSVAALQQGTVTALKAKGVPLYTVAECLYMDPYETVTGYYGTRDSTWTCEGDYTPSSTTSSGSTSTTSASQSCATTYTPTSATTCDAVGALFGISGSAVQAANAFVNCADIWAWTSLCIPSIGTPTSTSTSTSSTQAPSCVQTYTSVSGDNCDSIGSKFGLTGSAIQAANSFLNCNDIWAWTPICIPAGGSSNPTTSSSSSAPAPSCVSTYTAVSGDTCDSIGSKYGLTGSAIQSANAFVTCTDIWAYTPICIPPGGTQQCSVKYYSKAGDNCDSIGAAYGVTGSQILSWNDYLNCSDIWAGTPIKICS